MQDSLNRIEKKLETIHKDVHKLDLRVTAMETKLKIYVPFISALFVFMWNKAKSILGA